MRSGPKVEAVVAAVALYSPQVNALSIIINNFVIVVVVNLVIVVIIVIVVHLTFLAVDSLASTLCAVFSGPASRIVSDLDSVSSVSGLLAFAVHWGEVCGEGVLRRVEEWHHTHSNAAVNLALGVSYVLQQRESLQCRVRLVLIGVRLVRNREGCMTGFDINIM